MKLVITANGLQKPSMRPVLELAHDYFDEVVMNPWGRRGTQEEIRQIWDGAEVIICGAEPFDRDFIAEAPETLRVLSHYGVGVDSIDLPACRERGILVCNTPGANADSVADMALCLMLATVRQVVNHDRHTRLGEWKRFPSMELKGKTLGIIGFGAIGQEVAKRAAGFGMVLMAYDPFFNEAAAQALSVERAGLGELLEKADIVTLHLPCNPSTYHIIDRKALSAMKEGAVLVNTARGDLIDEQALAEALENRHLLGAGLDVYSGEPIRESPLFRLENVTLMPHCAANTPEAAMKMGMMAVENAHRALCGLDGAHILCPEAGRTWVRR